MATATTKTTTEIPEFAQKLREQLISTVQQSQQMSLEAAQTFVKAVSVLPIPDLPAMPGAPAMPGIEVVTKYSFDVAADLLNSQRDFVLQLAKVFSEKSA